jgi:hypothetical protein
MFDNECWVLMASSVEQSIHYDMEDLIEQANEIQETMGRTYGVPDEVDEADLEAGMWFLCSLSFPNKMVDQYTLSSHRAASVRR